MTRNEVIKQLEEVITEATYPDRPRKFMMPLDLAEETLELLKAQEPVEPKRIIITRRKTPAFRHGVW